MRICILIIDNCLKFLGCSQRILIRDGSRNFSSRFLGRDKKCCLVSSRPGKSSLDFVSNQEFWSNQKSRLVSICIYWVPKVSICLELYPSCLDLVSSRFICVSTHLGRTANFEFACFWSQIDIESRNRPKLAKNCHLGPNKAPL